MLPTLNPHPRPWAWVTFPAVFHLPRHSECQQADPGSSMRHFRTFPSPGITAEDSPVSRTRRLAHETSLADLFVSRMRRLAHETTSEDTDKPPPVPILSPGHFGTPDKPLLYQKLSHSLFRITFFLRICFELFVWRLRAISSPAAHLGNPDKFDCPQFGRRVESETLQFRPLLPRKTAVGSDWKSGKKMKIFSP